MPVKSSVRPSGMPFFSAESDPGLTGMPFPGINHEGRLPLFSDDSRGFGGEPTMVDRAWLMRVMPTDRILDSKLMADANRWYEEGSVNIDPHHMTQTTVNSIIEARDRFVFEFLAGRDTDSTISKSWQSYKKSHDRSGIPPNTFVNACRAYEENGVDVGFLLQQSNLTPFRSTKTAIIFKLEDINDALGQLNFQVPWDEVDLINGAKGILTTSPEKLTVIGEFVRLAKGDSPDIRDIADLITYDPAMMVVAAINGKPTPAYVSHLMQKTREKQVTVARKTRQHMALELTDEINMYNRHVERLIGQVILGTSDSGVNQGVRLNKTTKASPFSALARAYEQYVGLPTKE